ncbi:MAG: hypothetical protein R3C97_01390 [Geminicoccaceae bacterium]
MPAQICIFGHSHVWSIRRAIHDIELDDFTFTAPLCGTQAMPGPIVYADRNGRFQLTSTLAALFNGLEPSQDLWLLSMVQGNFYNRLGMLHAGEPFDFVLPDHADLPLDIEATHLPYMAMREALVDEMAEMPPYLELLAASPFAKQVIIAGAPPPPLENSHFEALLGDQGLMPQLSPAHVRLKLWLLQEEILEEQCRAHGIAFVSTNMKDAQDEQGYLLPQHIKDAVHADGTWSKAYLMKVTGEIRSRMENLHD